MTEPYYQDDAVTIYHGDCREIVEWVRADAIVTDPPYGTGGTRRDGPGQGSSSRGGNKREDWDDGAIDWLISVPTLTFWNTSQLHRLLPAAIALGLTRHRALHMHKLDPMPTRADVTRFSVEQIWALLPEGVNLRGGTDWIAVSTPRAGRDIGATGHPYEKPIEAMTWAIAKLNAPLIADPFMGSGTTLRAAKDLGRRAIGIEKSERYCEIAANRMAQEVLAFG